jgi:2-polyprenyl-3-methyl-5-hydroxy-6-metoxy-1,4-benzoquinol methylase
MSETITHEKPKGPLAAISSFFTRKVLRTDRSRWNYQYDKGLWDGLEHLNELPRFSILAGYVHFLKPDNPSILEIGCGEGALAQRIGANHYGAFLGTDVADAAIERANSRFGDQKTRFEAVDMNDLQTDQTFDLIIFNEAIYYLKPMVDKLLFQYAPMLKPDGLIIISMNTGPHAKSEEKWAQIEQGFDVVDGSYVKTAKNAWDIKILRPLPVSQLAI